MEFSYYIKSPTGQDRTAAESSCRSRRPAAGGESCKQDSFYVMKIMQSKILSCIIKKVLTEILSKDIRACLKNLPHSEIRIQEINKFYF